MKKVLIAVNARRGTSVMAGSSVKVSQSERQSNKYKHAKCCPEVVCVDEDSCKVRRGMSPIAGSSVKLKQELRKLIFRNEHCTIDECGF